MRATITDLKLTDYTKYKIDLSSANTYYPFGMLMPERNWSTDWYRYGFQGQEKDDEIKGVGNSVNYTYRMDDTRLGRFFTIDPLNTKYPMYSPYHFSSNQPIHARELEGLESSLDMNMNAPNRELAEKNNFNDVTPHLKAMVNFTVDYIFGGKAARDEGEAIIRAKNEDGTVDWLKIANLMQQRAKFDDLPIQGSSIRLKAASKKSLNDPGLRNQFKSKSIQEVKAAMQKHVETGKLEMKYQNPETGSTSYKNTESGASYNVDTGIQKNSQGKQVEPAHIDVNYPKPKPKNKTKKKLEIDNNETKGK